MEKNTSDILKSAALESQGHAGLLQNFDPFDEGDAAQGKFRITVDFRTIIAASVTFLMIAVAAVWFAYNAGASSIPSGSTNTTGANSTVLKRGDTSTSDQSTTVANQQSGGNSGAAPQAASDATPSAANVPASSCTSVQAPTPEKAVDANGVVNINTATLSELQEIKGVGPSMAQKIIDYRTEFGAFQTIEDLKEIKGVGDATYEKMKPQVRVK
ncbi:MAG: ComEA family DNA-binding protein [Candidatus Ancillula sp.]|jgi:competence protein ComEA|nr:ComEA family DNA-binding protein [Candidatus Ancillula sp.]